MTHPIILYSKPGCHLCEGLHEKLEQIPDLSVEIRDISTRDDWWRAYQYEVPVLARPDSDPAGENEQPIPRPSPRSSVKQLTQMLQKYFPDLGTE